MKEIKFRFWCKERLEFIEIEEIGVESDGSWWYLKCVDDEMPHYVPEELEIMQYTGLKDKNGCDIYEGDIIRADSSGTFLDKFYKGYQGYWKQKVVEDIRDCYFKSFTDKIEVIGNIYEHKHLLESEGK